MKSFLQIIFSASTLFIININFYLFAPIQNITIIESFNEAAGILNQATQNTLVLFDVDKTLLLPSSKIWWPYNQLHYEETIFNIEKEAKKRTTWLLNNRYQNFLLSKQYLGEKRILIEPEIVNTIKSLQNKGINVLGLTALSTGPFYSVKSLEELRFKQLNDVGINFNTSPNQKIIFNNLIKEYEDVPLFYKGTLHSCAIPKGIVLGEFLNYVQWKPDCIIFFDDSPECIQSVKEETQKRSIDYYGYLYKGADTKKIKFDPSIAALQLNYLMDHEEWISEEEIMHKKKLLEKITSKNKE